MATATKKTATYRGSVHEQKHIEWCEENVESTKSNLVDVLDKTDRVSHVAVIHYFKSLAEETTGVVMEIIAAYSLHGEALYNLENAKEMAKEEAFCSLL